MTNRLFTQISIIGILLVILLVLSITIIAGRLLYEDTKTLLDTQAQQAVTVFDQYMDILKNTAMTASRQSSIQSLISGDSTGYSSYIVYRDAYTYLKNVHEFYNRVNIHVIVKDIHYIMSSNPVDVTGDYRKNGVYETDWFIEVEKSIAGTVFLSNFIPTLSSDQEQFAFVLKVRNLYNWETDGYIVASIDKDVIGDLFKGTSLEQNGFLLVLTPEGKIAFNSDPILFEKNFTLEEIQSELGDSNDYTSNQNRNFYYSSCLSVSSGWRFITFTDKRYAKAQVFKFQLLMIFVAIITITLLIVIARKTSKAYNRPIERLIQFIHMTEENEYAGQIDLQSEDEVADLLHSFNAMIASVRQNQVLRKRAEIDALQKQINPHFLFNTFESIKALAQLGDTKNVSTMIEKLSDIFRYNTNKEGSFLVEIREEVNHIQNYLDIQRVRYGSRMQVAYKIDESCLSYLTPRFILQPIIENSIGHAMEYMKSGYHLEISIHIEGNDIIMSVKDNGPGISDKEMIKLKKHVYGTCNSECDDLQGIGLKNIQERLVLLYGKEYGISIFSIFEKYVEIHVRIPKSKIAEKEVI